MGTMQTTLTKVALQIQDSSKDTTMVILAQKTKTWAISKELMRFEIDIVGTSIEQNVEINYYTVHLLIYRNRSKNQIQKVRREAGILNNIRWDERTNPLEWKPK